MLHAKSILYSSDTSHKRDDCLPHRSTVLLKVLVPHGLDLVVGVPLSNLVAFGLEFFRDRAPCNFRELEITLDKFAIDEHRLDVRVRRVERDARKGVFDRGEVDRVRVEHDEVCALADLDGTDEVCEVQRLRAAERRKAERVAAVVLIRLRSCEVVALDVLVSTA